MHGIIEYSFIGGPACGRGMHFMEDSERRVWIPRELFVGSTGDGNFTPSYETLSDAEMGKLLLEGGRARGPEVHRQHLIFEWIEGVYLINHSTLRLYWVDLASTKVAAVASQNVRKYQLLSLFLLNEQAMEAGDADFIGKVSDGVHTAVLHQFQSDRDLVTRAQNFHRLRMDRYKRGL